MRNRYLNTLSEPYLFASVTEQVARHPNPVDLGVGDTSLPIPTCIVEELKRQADAFGSPQGFRGYGPEHGLMALREAIAHTFYPTLSPDEIFISDGAKTDMSRLQALFDASTTVALQDPTYPTYKEAALLSGKQTFYTLPCTPQNHFFPEQLPQADLYIICSPHNPTGHALTRSQLTHLIETAHKHHSLILFDAAYSMFIDDPALPKTPYELPGGDEVTIEIHSFSKLVSFTGLRLSWSVVPKKLRFRDGASVHRDWARLVSMFHNGTSRLIQAAGMTALSPLGQTAIAHNINIYHRRAQRLKKALSPYFPTIYGGVHTPYLWIPAPLSHFQEVGIIGIPGEGFGHCGQGFVRLSAFGNDETIDEAIRRCSQFPKVSST